MVEAQALLDAGRPFHAHEVFEDAWKNAPDGEEQFWRGLAQVAVGLTHAARGNLVGAATLLHRGAENVGGHAATHPGPVHGMDAAALAGQARALAGRARAGEAPDAAAFRLR